MFVLCISFIHGDSSVLFAPPRPPTPRGCGRVFLRVRVLHVVVWRYVGGQGDVEGVRRCLNAGYQVNQQDELGCTPVHLAGALVRHSARRRNPPIHVTSTITCAGQAMILCVVCVIRTLCDVHVVCSVV